LPVFSAPRPRPFLGHVKNGQAFFFRLTLACLVRTAAVRAGLAALLLTRNLVADPPWGTVLLGAKAFLTVREDRTGGLVLRPVETAAECEVVGGFEVVCSETTVAVGTNW
jgi:hypothetical protein